MTTPNLFHYATSELSQDAILAYLLSWANPKYKKANPSLNELGKKLVRSLVASWTAASNTVNPLSDKSIESITVGTQRERIDIWVEINEDIVLILEDKTDTVEHSDQISRYVTKAGHIWPNRKPLAVYVKTGNECPPTPRNDIPCGIFLRSDLLEVLKKVKDTGNTIIEEFRCFLHEWQTSTDSYTSIPYHNWTWNAKQGYYNYLNGWLSDKDIWSQWDYVPNPSGGFLGFWWHWKSLSRLNCDLYLQIEDTSRLQIRINSMKRDSKGNLEKVESNLMWEVLSVINNHLAKGAFPKIRVQKSGRYRGGKYAAVVDVFFDDKDTYLATDDHGIIDLRLIEDRLLLAMQFIDVVCAEEKDQNDS